MFIVAESDTVSDGHEAARSSPLPSRDPVHPVFSKVSSAFRTFGVFAGLLYLASQMLDRVGSRFRVIYYDLVAQPVADTPVAPARFTRSIEVRQVAAGDPAMARMPIDEDTLAFRLQQQVVCLAAFRKGEIVAYLWLCFGAFEEDEARCTFVPEPAAESAWDFDVYVFPEQRLGLGFVALWDGANDYLRNRGVRYSFSRVSRFNVASQKNHEKFGWHRLGRCWFVKGRRFQLMVATVRPYVHLSFSGRSQPLIRLRVEA